ncbi:hypothetical protein CYMTET_29554, partial [Cymbomonas tetramitiformis]
QAVEETQRKEVQALLEELPQRLASHPGEKAKPAVPKFNHKRSAKSVMSKMKIKMATDPGSLEADHEMETEAASGIIKIDECTIAENDGRDMLEYCRCFTNHWSGVSKEDVLELSNYMTFSTVSTNEVIVKKGDAGSFVCIILSGLAEARVGSGIVIPPGNFVGELALFKRGERNATVISIHPVTVVAHITMDNLMAIHNSNPALSCRFIKLLTEAGVVKMRNFAMRGLHNPALILSKNGRMRVNFEGALSKVSAGVPRRRHRGRTSFESAFSTLQERTRGAHGVIVRVHDHVMYGVHTM